jgi:M6 family metalloprotease-like protein
MKKSVLLFVFFFASYRILFAVPAYPFPIVYTQPNGDTLTVKIKGDERIHWYESLDEYTLLVNSEGFLSYAQLDEDGNLQPSSCVATDIENRDFSIFSFLKTIKKRLFYSTIQKQMMLKIWQIEDEVANKNKNKNDGLFGHYKTLCAFVQFPEKPMIKTMSQFDGLLNQLGFTGNGTGSVRDYFKESSYNNFDLEITLCGIYTAPQSEAYYADYTAPLARWLAMRLAWEPAIDFREFDSNGDGEVDGFHFIFAGRGEEAGGGPGTIWSHKSQFDPPVKQNGKSISIYSCSPELLYNDISTIGVICHEMTHAFGAPDFYDTGYNGYEGTGNWDIMASGSWNGYPGGNCPPHHNMYTKLQFGWVDPINLDDPETVVNMPNSAENPVAYKIKTTTFNEFFLLENRQKLKFDSSVPGAGLLIYRVVDMGNSQGLNDGHPQNVYPVCAASNIDIPNSDPSSYGDPLFYGSINGAGTPFPGTSNQTSFTDETTPSMKSWLKNNTNKPITNIVNNNLLISFEFMGGACFVVENMTVELKDSCSMAIISWDEPKKGTQYTPLWDNMAGTESKGYYSIRWMGGATSELIVVADDFIVQEDEIWFVKEVSFYGYPELDQPENIGVAFYFDNGDNTPKTTPFYENSKLIPDGGIITGEMTVTLPKPVIIKDPGRYWVSVYGAFEGSLNPFRKYYIGCSSIAKEATMCRWDPLNIEGTGYYSPIWKPNKESNWPSLAFLISGYKQTDSVTQYFLYRDGKIIAGPTIETNFIDVGFDNTMSHTWSVTAVCSHTGEGKPINVKKDACFVGIDNVDFQNVKIYSHLNSVYLQSDEPGGIVSIFNTMGKLVYQCTITDVNTVIPLNVSDGIYCVRLVTQNNKITAKKVLLMK